MIKTMDSPLDIEEDLKINVIEEIQLRIPFLSTTKSFINKPKLIIKSQSIQENQVMPTNENMIIITEKSIIKATKDIIKAYLVEAETKMLDEIANEENDDYSKTSKYSTNHFNLFLPHGALEIKFVIEGR